jgi:hypothetical protein
VVVNKLPTFGLVMLVGSEINANFVVSMLKTNNNIAATGIPRGIARHHIFVCSQTMTHQNNLTSIHRRKLGVYIGILSICFEIRNAEFNQP